MARRASDAGVPNCAVGKMALRLRISEKVVDVLQFGPLISSMIHGKRIESGRIESGSRR